MKVEEILRDLEAKHPGEKEYFGSTVDGDGNERSVAFGSRCLQSASRIREKQDNRAHG